MAAVLRLSSLSGSSLSSCLERPQRSQQPRSFGPVIAGTWRKVNKVDDGWKKGFWGSGYFNEGNASPDNNYLKRIEAKKLLSTIEKSGLLSKADKAGLTLSRIEQSKLLSTAENLGLLATVERLFVTDPGKVTALSIPFFLASAGILVLFPHDNAALQLLQYLLLALTVGVTVTFFAGGFVLASLQDD
ncbi:hypothetical protein ABBQ38_002262 [Trebouxia sp. C0009 RCD-2024]